MMGVIYFECEANALRYYNPYIYVYILEIKRSSKSDIDLFGLVCITGTSNCLQKWLVA